MRLGISVKSCFSLPDKSLAPGGLTGSPKVEWLEAVGLERGYWNAGGFDYVPTGCPQILHLEAAGCSEQTRRHVSKDRDLSIDPHLNLTRQYVRQNTGCSHIILSGNSVGMCCRMSLLNRKWSKTTYVNYTLKSGSHFFKESTQLCYESG